MAVDALGNPLRVILSAGQIADIDCAAPLIKNLPSQAVVADKGYDSTALRDRIWDAGSCPCIPNLKNRKNPARWHRGFYKLRHRVENFFQRMKRFRGISTRYDKLQQHFLSAVHLVAVLDWICFKV